MHLTLERLEDAGNGEIWWGRAGGDILLEKRSGKGRRNGVKNCLRADQEGDKDCTVKKIKE